MALQVVGAGLPRTGTSSLRVALEQLLGGKCCHMSMLPGHPFNLGEGWGFALANKALASDGAQNSAFWDGLMAQYTAAVDWPASAFWRELSAANPDALVLLSVRDSAETWLASLETTVLPAARMALADDWADGRDLVRLFERFTGTPQTSGEWNDPAVLKAAYERQNAAVRESIPAGRRLEWNAKEGWEPICRALGVAVPDEPFPHANRREDWG